MPLPIAAVASMAGSLGGGGGGAATSGDIHASGPTINVAGPGMNPTTVGLIVLAAVVLAAVLMKKGR